MVSLIQPLSAQVAIVDDQGCPTPQFITILQKLGIGAGLSSSNGSIQLATIAAKTILANKTVATGSPTSCTMSDILDFVTTTRGSILFRGAAGWQALVPGTANQVLQTNGPGADPTWATPAAGGSTYPPFSPPTAASLTLNSGDATNLILSNDTDVGLIFDGNTFVGGSLSRIATMQLPTGTGAGPGDTDWTFFAEIAPSQPMTFGSVGLHLYESATGKQLAFGILPTAGNGLYAWGAATLTGFATTVKNSAVNYLPGAPLYLGFKYTKAAGIYYFMISADAKNWVPWVSATLAASFTTRADRVGFGVMHGAASTMTGDKRLGSCRWFSKSF